MPSTPSEEHHESGWLGQLGLNGLLVCAGLLAGFALSTLFGFGAFLIIPLFFVGRIKGPSFGRYRNTVHTDERE
jgi:hypothetical protein